MKKLFDMWDACKSYVDHARTLYARAQEKGSSDPMDVVFPLAFREMMKRQEQFSDPKAITLLGAYLAGRYPELAQEAPNKRQLMMLSGMEDILASCVGARGEQDQPGCDYENSSDFILVDKQWYDEQIHGPRKKVHANQQDFFGYEGFDTRGVFYE